MAQPAPARDQDQHKNNTTGPQPGGAAPGRTAKAGRVAKGPRVSVDTVYPAGGRWGAVGRRARRAPAVITTTATAAGTATAASGSRRGRMTAVATMAASRPADSGWAAMPLSGAAP